jgi:hypothetical protein
MDDDFVGLGDLLIVPDPDVYGVDQTVNLQTDSVKIISNIFNWNTCSLLRHYQVRMKAKKTIKIL